MLVGQGVSKIFGGLVALDNVDFEVKKSSITGLIGPNGAGKTTLFNCIHGVYPLSAGTILFEGKKITGYTPDKICKLGIARTFQIVHPFRDMTGIDNVLVGALYGREATKNVREAKQKVEQIMDFVELADKKEMLVNNYTLAEQKRLEIAKALAASPKLLLLDEVAAGLNPTESLQAMELIRNIRSKLGITVLWIEHVMDALMNVVDHVIVLDYGKKICEGSPGKVCANQNVIDAYLGAARPIKEE
jgi:branched-chain amino acid transport system ATP-binding protein